MIVKNDRLNTDKSISTEYLWNFLGEERLIINTRSLSYQQHYGFFNTALQTISLNKKILIRAYDQTTENELTLVKFLVESYNDKHLNTTN